MISPSDFISALKNYGIGLLTGVPDSLLKNFCSEVDSPNSGITHVIAANEGNAVAIASGYHLSSGKIAAVYMQNSGLGNTVNPLTSIADAEVYRIPMLLIVGWRGEPGKKDEPQHIKQGRITPGQLELLEVPYYIVDASTDISSSLAEAFATIRKTNAPVALLIRADTFLPATHKSKKPALSTLKREDALRKILELSEANDVVISTTGKTSRELFELRVERNEEQRDFLTVGGMGHTSSIALGVALGNPGKRVLCVDGDGSLLMHMGAMAIIGSLKPNNFIHILLNNSAHESVGGQPTVAGEIDMEALAKAQGYSGYACCDSLATIETAWSQLMSAQQDPVLLEIRISTGSRDDLGRPTSTPEANKQAFMKVACPS